MKDRITSRRPAVDIIETSDAWIVTADIPGAAPDAVSLELEDGVLTLEVGVTRDEPRDATFVRREFDGISFLHRFRVGDEVDAEGIEATCADGVLTLRLPRADHLRARRVTVTAN